MLWRGMGETLGAWWYEGLVVHCWNEVGWEGEMTSMWECFRYDRGLRWLSVGCLESTKFSSSN